LRLPDQTRLPTANTGARLVEKNGSRQFLEQRLDRQLENTEVPNQFIRLDGKIEKNMLVFSQKIDDLKLSLSQVTSPAEKAEISNRIDSLEKLSINYKAAQSLYRVNPNGKRVNYFNKEESSIILSQMKEADKIADTFRLNDDRTQAKIQAELESEQRSLYEMESQLDDANFKAQERMNQTNRVNSMFGNYHRQPDVSQAEIDQLIQDAEIDVAEGQSSSS
jgi:hypothetical protein